MKMKAFLTGFLITVLVGGTAVVSFAQQTGQHEAAKTDTLTEGGRRAPLKSRREDVMKKIETVRIWRLTEALKLDETTAARLAALLASIDRQREAIMRDQRSAMRDLRLLSNSAKPDEARLEALLDRIEKNRHAMQELRSNEISGAKNILTVVQQAQFVIFQHDFRREIGRIISGGRGGRSVWDGRGSDRGLGIRGSQPQAGQEQYPAE